MPKKTKKQKIAAAKRKHTVFLQSEFKNLHVETPSVTVIKAEAKKESTRIVELKEVNDFKKDLFKSLILTFIILTMTVGLYIARENSFIKFF